jgi:hypothetical protein
MTCEEFREVVHELARPGLLERTSAAIARAHAENCPSCACRLTEAELSAKAFAVAARESRMAEAPARLERELLEKFRCEQNARRVVPRRLRRGWRIALEWAAVSAAVALVTFAMWNRVPDHQPAPVVRNHAVPAAALNEVAPVARQTAAANVENSSGPGKVAVSAAATETEEATEFVPVPFSGELAPGDSAVIVRVQLPRTALAELGYPIDETRGEELVRADLVVGQDGWPHAVRLVR